MLTLLLGGCVGSPAESPFEFYRQLTTDGLDGRQPPPGVDAPYPNLGQVPPRPERPPAEARDALSAALLRERQMAGAPIRPGLAVPPRPLGLEGSLLVPAGPPPIAALSSAPPVLWDLPAVPRPAALPSPAAAPGRPVPAAATPNAAPPAAVTPGSRVPAVGQAPAAPAAAAMPDAPPPPPPPDLFAPGVPPAPPPAELLAPRR